MQRTIPIVAIRESIFPHTVYNPLFGRNKSMNPLMPAFQGDKIVAIFNQKDPNTDNPEPSDLHEIGTIATGKSNDVNRYEVHAMIQEGSQSPLR